MWWVNILIVLGFFGALLGLGKLMTGRWTIPT